MTLTWHIMALHLSNNVIVLHISSCVILNVLNTCKNTFVKPAMADVYLVN